MVLFVCLSVFLSVWNKFLAVTLDWFQGYYLGSYSLELIPSLKLIHGCYSPRHESADRAKFDPKK